MMPACWECESTDTYVSVHTLYNTVLVCRDCHAERQYIQARVDPCEVCGDDEPENPGLDDLDRMACEPCRVELSRRID
jgi:hypothetical protein